MKTFDFIESIGAIDFYLPRRQVDNIKVFGCILICTSLIRGTRDELFLPLSYYTQRSHIHLIAMVIIWYPVENNSSFEKLLCYKFELVQSSVDPTKIYHMALYYKLGSLLFLFYINDLANYINNINFLCCRWNNVVQHIMLLIFKDII